MGGWPTLSQILVAVALVAFTANVIIYTQMYTSIPEPTGAVSPLCGDNEVDEGYGEECDGIDDEACPDHCLSNCTCPQAGSRMRADVPLYRQRFYFNNLTQNETVKINTTKPELAFVSISFVMPNSTNNFTFEFDSNTSAPANAPLPSGVVYEYLNFSHRSNHTNLEDFAIEYRVNKSWLAAKNVDFNTVHLEYFRDKIFWQKLDTNHTKETGTHHYYSSFSSGMGRFAIVGYKVPEPAPLAAPSIPYCGNGKMEENETFKNCCADAGCPEGFYCNTAVNTCQLYALCGNDQCDYNETLTSCPGDCARRVFFSPFYWLLLAGIIALSVIGFLILTEEYKEIIKPKPRTPLMALKFKGG